MTSPAQLRYAERATNGVYTSLLEQVDEGGTRYLVNCEYMRDFMCKTRWKDSFDFQMITGEEFKACVFGEIQWSAMGTKHSTFGSHFIGKGKASLNIDCVVAFVDVLNSPTTLMF